MSSGSALRDAFTFEIDLHLSAVSPSTRAVLHRLVRHDDFPGSSDPRALALLLAIVRGVQPRLMLELGTHVGFSTLCIADVLEHNTVKGELVTVDPNANSQRVAAGFLADAGLGHRVRFVEGLSTDAEVGGALSGQGPFELAYVDSSHSYGGTLRELELLFEKSGGWLVGNGVLIAHDAAPEAAVFDPTGAGGVPRALEEWIAKRRKSYELLVLGPPLWPCEAGVGIVRRR